MQINIQAHDFPLTSALRGHVERRLGSALSRRYDYIQRIMVRLFDVNGPRGGEDKCCRIQIELPKQRDVVIESTTANLYCAIDHASDRAGRTVRRRLAKRRDKGRASGMPDIEKIED